MNIGGMEARKLLLESIKFIGPENELKLPEKLAKELDTIIRSVDLLESSTEPPKKQIGRLKANFQTVLLAHFNKDIDLKLEALKQTKAAIKKFNRDNGAGAMLGKAIAGALFAHIRREEDGFDNHKAKPKPEPIRASDLEKKFSNYIQQMGLKIHSSDEDLALVTGIEVRASDKEDNRGIEFGEAMLQDTSSKVSLVIRDPEKFTSFLESLEGKDLKAHTKGNLNQMVLAIEDQFLAAKPHCR